VSDIVETEFGRIQRGVVDGEPCGSSNDQAVGREDQRTMTQLHGRASIDHASHGCPAGYHETLNFRGGVSNRFRPPGSARRQRGVTGPARNYHTRGITRHRVCRAYAR
jgi:hypothetical protein